MAVLEMSSILKPTPVEYSYNVPNKDCLYFVEPQLTAKDS